MTEHFENIGDCIDFFSQTQPLKLVISNPKNKADKIKKITAERKENSFQISKCTDKQVFHENVDLNTVFEICRTSLSEDFTQMNA